MSRKISGLAKCQRTDEFFCFDLEGGGRINIPPGRVMYLWNAEQERSGTATMEPLTIPAKSISVALDEKKGIGRMSTGTAALAKGS